VIASVANRISGLVPVAEIVTPPAITTDVPVITQASMGGVAV
jgi:hypothetical protein